MQILRRMRKRWETINKSLRKNEEIIMFGFGRKEQDIRLTQKEINQLKSNMTRSERKAFEKRQRRAEDDRMWDAMCMAELFMDDED